MSEKKELLFGTIISYSTVAIQILSTLILTPFLLGNLGDNEYGIYKIVVALIAYLSILNFGWGNSLVRFLSEFRIKGEIEKSRELISFIRLMNLLAIFVALLIGIIVFYNIPTAFSQSLSDQDLKLAQNIYIVLAGSVIATIATDYYSSFVYVYEKFVYAKLIEFIKQVVRVVLLLTVVSNWSSAIFVALVDFAISIVVLIANICISKKELDIKTEFFKDIKGIKISNYYEVLKYAMLFFLNLIVEQLIWNTDSIIIGMRLSAQEVAIFSSGATISAAFYSMTILLNNMLFPKIVKEVTVQGTINSTNTMVRVGRVQAYIAMFIFVGYFMIGNEFVRNIWLGENYGEAWTTSIIVMAGTLFSSLLSSGHLYLRAINKQVFFLVTYFVIFLINAIFTYILVEDYGIVAAAIATTVSYIIGMCGFIVPYYKKTIGLKISQFIKNVFPIVISTMCLGLIYKGVVSCIKNFTIVHMCVCIILYTISYCLLAYIVLLNKEEKDMINKFLEKFKNRM